MAQDGPEGPEWPKMAQSAQNGPKWPRMAQNGPEGPKWLMGPNMAQGAQNCSDGPEIIKESENLKISETQFFLGHPVLQSVLHCNVPDYTKLQCNAKQSTQGTAMYVPAAIPD